MILKRFEYAIPCVCPLLYLDILCTSRNQHPACDKRRDFAIPLKNLDADAIIKHVFSPGLPRLARVIHVSSQPGFNLAGGLAFIIRRDEGYVAFNHGARGCAPLNVRD